MNPNHQVLIVLLVPLALAGLKLLCPKIPKAWLPMLAPLLGILTEQAAQAAGIAGISPLWAAVLGMAGVGLREIGDQLKKNRLIGPALFLCLALPFAGCARFSTTQKDLSYDANGYPLRTITTHAAATTFFAADSKLATWKATQSDKSQGATVGGLEQSADSSQAITNAGAFLGAVIREAAKK